MNTNKYLDIAVSTAKKSGLALLSEENIIINGSKDKDIKLQSDLDSEEIIFSELKKESNFDILSEESGFIKGSSNSSFRWIVDPLDGSLNFSRKIPICCISIALWDNDIPVLGVIYDFNNDKMYRGIVGEGSYCNDIPINVSSVIDKKDSIICTGFPVYSTFESDNLLKFVTKLQTFKKVRLLGSAALSSVMVASGSVEVYNESSIALWDVAAGIAIVEAAGGYVEYNFIDSKNHLLDVWAFNSKSLK